MRPLAHTASLLDQLFERGDLSAELVELRRSGELVQEPIPCLLVQVILVLLRVDQLSRQGSETPRPLGGRELLQLLQQLLLLAQAAFERFVDGTRRARQAALKDGAGQGAYSSPSRWNAMVCA
jgi:hypothetical protein